MGLDRFAYSVKPENDSDVSDLEYPDGERSEITYWRKFNAFHGWMENLYKSKGGTDSFNCVPVRLTLKDLDRLEDELPDLKPVEGFFFGGQEIYPEDMIHFGFPLQMPEISLMRATWYTTIRGGN